MKKKEGHLYNNENVNQKVGDVIKALFEWLTYLNDKSRNKWIKLSTQKDTKKNTQANRVGNNNESREKNRIAMEWVKKFEGSFVFEGSMGTNKHFSQI